MRTQSTDTQPDVERVLIDMIRYAPMSKRFHLVQALTQTMLWANVHAWCNHQQTSERDAAVHVLSCTYGPLLAQQTVDALSKREGWHMQPIDLGILLFSTLRRLKALGLPAYVAGSIASSLHGMQQLAQDCDLVVHMDERTLSSFAMLFEQDYAFERDALQEAVQHHTAFSLIHLDSLMKIDMVIPRRDTFDEAMLPLVASHTLDTRYPPFQLASAAEMLLFKLQRYVHDERSRTDGMKDDAEWNDLLGMLKVQGPTLDRALLESWVIALSLDEAWQHALIDAGLKET